MNWKKWFKLPFIKADEWKNIIMEFDDMEKNIKNEPVNHEACACIELKSILDKILYCKGELLKSNSEIDKQEIYQILSSIEFDIGLINDKDNYIERY